MKKVYEIAVIEDDLPVEILEHECLDDCLIDVYRVAHRFKEYERIEISTREQTDKGKNENTYIWATINIKEFLKGEK